MAPEFFPFLFVAFLLGAIVVLVIGAIFVRPLQRLLQFIFSFVLKHLRAILVVVMVPCVAALLFNLWFMRQQYFLNEPMTAAAGEGDIEKVQKLLDKGASPKGYGTDGVEPAIVAATVHGHADIVRLLLSRDADPEAKDIHGKTALHYARALGDSVIVELLIKAGARE